MFDENAKQIWTGDFNALTKEDYIEEGWTQVYNIRQRNSWELPQTDLTAKVEVFMMWTFKQFAKPHFRSKVEASLIAK